MNSPCAECAKKDAVIAALQEALRPVRYDLGTFNRPATDRTASCPCRPENGGSGICGCVLGGLQVTC